MRTTTHGGSATDFAEPRWQRDTNPQLDRMHARRKMHGIHGKILEQDFTKVRWRVVEVLSTTSIRFSRGRTNEECLDQAPMVDPPFLPVTVLFTPTLRVTGSQLAQQTPRYLY